MYQEILKQATGDKDFEFSVRTTTEPFASTGKKWQLGQDTRYIVLVCSIAYSMAVISPVSQAVVERASGLKHLQIISGLQLPAYWIGNFIFDGFRLYIQAFAVYYIFEIYDCGFDTAYMTILLFPIGILPFSYMLSFIFSEDHQA